MADPSPLDFQLDRTAVSLLATLTDGVVIGVVNLPSLTIRLFVGAEQTDVANNRFAGHRELLRAGLVHFSDTAGFSFEIAAGRIRAFYRASILNRDFDDFAIPHAMMLEVLAAVGLPKAADFRFYPSI